MSGFGSAGRLLFTACGKLRINSVYGRPDAQFPGPSMAGNADLSPLTSSFRCMSVSPVCEKAKVYKIEESLGMAPPPPKPMTPYLRWSKENRAQLITESPGKKFTEIGKYLGSVWTALPEDKRKPYVAAYEKDVVVYKKKREEYLAKLTDSDKAAISKARHDAAVARQARRERVSLKKKFADFNKPKRPMSAFMLYSAKRRQELADAAKTGAGGPSPYADLALKDQAKKIGEEWRSMSPSDKEPFVKQYTAELAKYRSELDAWEQRMVSQGHQDLVRVKTRSRIDEDGHIRREKKTRADGKARKKLLGVMIGDEAAKDKDKGQDVEVVKK